MGRVMDEEAGDSDALVRTVTPLLLFLESLSVEAIALLLWMTVTPDGSSPEDVESDDTDADVRYNGRDCRR